MQHFVTTKAYNHRYDRNDDDSNIDAETIRIDGG